MQETRRARDGAAGFVVTAFVLGRVVLLEVVALARAWVPDRAPNDNRDFVAFPSHPLWDSFCRWDSGWYDRVARRGYLFQEGQSDVAFFPAFPYLSRWLGHGLGGHFAAGLVVSNLSLLGGLFFLYALAEPYVGAKGATRAVWMVLLYPATIFYSAYYTEGLFLFATAASLLFYERRRLLPAALFGSLAALTRLTGIFLFPALLVGVLSRHGGRARSVTARAAPLLLIPAGFSVFPLAMARQVGHPWAFLEDWPHWHRSLTEPLVTIARAARDLGSASFMDMLDLAAAFGLLAVVVVAARRLDVAHALFALLSVTVPLCSGWLRSTERYSASVVPVFVVLAHVTRTPRVAWAVFAISIALMVVQTALFVSWRWAG
jgi:hypothetical protein